MGSGEDTTVGRRSTPFSLRHPRALLAIALLVIAALAVIGRGVEDKLRPTSLDVPGTESSAANDLLRRYFGDTAPFAILLQGPAEELDAQGPDLVRALRTDPAVSTISPWDRGSVARLRPGPRKALVLVDFHVSPEEAVEESVPQLDRALEEEISSPVEATQTGFASLSRAIQEETLDSAKTAEKIAIPFLLLVLLLVFRSPVAAAIPLAFGAITVTASSGVIALAAPLVPINSFAITVATMMGLALGVDYSLLMVSRFREELAAGASPLEAARMTRRTAGRTTVFAGSTLFLAMLVTLFVMPGTLLISLAGTAIAVTAISVIVAGLVAPALLVLLGENIDRWRIGGSRDGTRVMTLVGAALSRPRLAAALIGGLLLLLAVPAFDLKTGPPSAEQLPASDPARQDAELVADTIGPGWDAPFVVVAVANEGTITDEENLAALSRWQRRIADDPGVQAVVGPAKIKERVAPLKRGGDQLIAGKGDADPEKLENLGVRLGDAAGAVKQLRSGIAAASYGAGLLATGTGRAGSGAGEIEGGLVEVTNGAEKAVDSLDRLSDGSERLADGQQEAQFGALSLKLNLIDLLPNLRSNGLNRARRLRADLNRRAAVDPTLSEQSIEAEKLVRVLAAVRDEVRELRGLATRLYAGQKKLAEGGAKLHKGTEELADGATELPEALGQLREGAAQLVGGLVRLRGGADTLEQRLAEGFQRSRPLQAGLRRANVDVTVRAARFERRVGQLRRSSPGIFDSGYFVLSALEGAPEKERERVSHFVDLEHGGQAAQIVVIPRYTFNTPGSEALNGRLKEAAAGLAGETGVSTGVTGGAAELIDYTDEISSRILIMIAVITIATFLILVVILRALLLSALAVALNLVTVAVAFGVLTLLFNVPEGWPLGGRTYVDAISAAGIFGIVFGLSIDYAVFLLMRMREHYENESSNEEAIVFGLERTARVITGAAAIMLAVFVVFAGAKIATISQLGVGLAVAVVLDATVVRIVLLPALMLIFGDRVWWMPGWLERILPKIDLHGSRAG
ncbi:MAG: MMPL family transporter [Solirubrobacterales bacterium]